MANQTVDLERSAPLALGGGSESRAFAAGDVLGERYRVVSALGEGGMGRVYRVSDVLHPERALALKTLALVAPGRTALLQAEFRTMSELAHPNVGHVYDFDALPTGESFFTMEYVDGRGLAEACRGQPLERIVEWIVESCRALQYLHSRGVLHADFKPHNVIVTAAGAKVLDFGLSGAVRAGLRLGTPLYTAPEISAGARSDERADLYALGIALYEVVFGALPFQARTAGELATLHATEPLAFPRETPVNTVIERLCRKAPGERPASANDVIDALAVAMGRKYPHDTPETRKSYVSSGRLVGRDRELQQLLEHCLDTPTAAMAAVSGPSGIGKTRLLAELRRQLQLGGVPFVAAACYEGSFSDVAPIVEWIRALELIGRAHGAGEVIDAHASDLAWLRDGQGASSEAARFERLRAVASFVIALSRELHVVLHVDDLQWARSSTLDFAKILYERIAAARDAGDDCRIRLVATFRDNEVLTGPVAEWLAVAPRRVSIALAPLDVAQTSELIAGHLGAPEVPEAFAIRMSHDTGGNPFFVEEALRALMERGDVAVQAGRWAAPVEAKDLEVPSTVAAALERRMAGIDPRDRELLDHLAIYAQPMPDALLAACCGRALDEVQPRLTTLAARHLLAAGDRPRIAHDKLREFLVTRMTGAERVAGHGRIARTLDAVAGAGEYVFERAHHYWHAGDEKSAAAWAERAAELGERTFATDAAIDNYERLRKVRDTERARHAATDKLLALALIAGRYERILEITDEELAHRTEPLDRAWMLQLQGEALGGRGLLEEASERLHRAVALLGGGVPRTRGLRRWFIARNYVRHMLTLGRAQREREIPLDERKRREILGVSYHLLSVYSLLLGDEEGIGVTFAAYNTVRPLRSGELVLRITHNVALMQHVLGRYRASQQLILQARALATTDADRAGVLVTEIMARQSTQVPIFTGQQPVHEYEAEVIGALDLLTARSKAIYLNVARVVATTTVWQFASKFRDRPEVTRWAESMRGTVHYTFVQGGAAVMALVAGDRARAEQGRARAIEAGPTPFYRAWLAANFAWAYVATGDRARALEDLRELAALLPKLESRTATALPILAFVIGAGIAVREDEPWLRELVDISVRRLERRRRLPPYLQLFRAVGRLHLGRGSARELERAFARSAERWAVEGALVGHPDGCLIAALVLGPSGQGAAYAAEGLRIVDERYPSQFAAHLRALLGV